MSRMQRMSFVLWIACKKVELQSGLVLRSIAKSMRRQILSGRCSAVSRSIHKSKTCSFRAGKDLSNDILVLKIDWQMTLQCLWRYRAASVFDQSWNRCVGKFRANAVQPFLAWFTKAKYARLEQEKIFPAISSVWKSTKKWRWSARLKLPAETGNRSTRSSSGFSSSPRQPRR